MKRPARAAKCGAGWRVTVPVHVHPGFHVPPHCPRRAALSFVEEDPILPSMPGARRGKESETIVEAVPAVQSATTPSQVSTPSTAPPGPATRRTCSANWRGGVRNQIARLEQDLARVPQPNSDEVGLRRVKEAISRARRSVDTPGSPLSWWGGNLASRAWCELALAREELIQHQSDDVVRAQLPYLKTLSGADQGTLAAIAAIKPKPSPVPLDVLAQAMREHAVWLDESHGRTRQLRNGIILAIVGIVAVLAVALHFSGPTLREAMGIGAAAGAASTVTALPTGTAISGPFGVLTAQALLKVVTGALTGWLGVLLMVFGGISALKVQGTGVILFAILFGFSQQLLTQMVDKQVGSLTGSKAPSSAAATKPR